jgi:hypothetical protein
VTFQRTELASASKRAVIEALDWFCAAVRVAAFPDAIGLSKSTCARVMYKDNKSEAVFEEAKPSQSDHALNFTFTLQRLSPLPIGQYSCWHALFTSGVVCYSPIIQTASTEESGYGLQISYDCLIQLAAVEIPVLVNGGYVLTGYSTALIPTRTLEDSIQWHFEASTEGQIDPYALKSLEDGKFSTVDDLERLRKSRCYVGWCSSAQINLGTQNLKDIFTWSDGRIQKRTMHWKGISLGAQAVSSAPAQIGGNFTSQYEFTINTQRFNPSASYSKMLRANSKQVALIYDDGSRRAWLVPKLSLILHLAQRWAKYYDIGEGVIPYAQWGTNGDSAESILAGSGSLVILGKGEDAFTLRQLILGLNTNLLGSMEKSELSAHQKLFGFEAMDVITEPPSGGHMRRMKISKKEKGWINIANMVDAVVVCSNLGSAISPAGKRDNPQCNEVPRGFDYLTASVPVLQTLFKKDISIVEASLKTAGFKFGENNVWELSGSPFEECLHASVTSGSCWESENVLQIVYEDNWTRKVYSQISRRRPTPGQPRIALQGAVVFGKSRDHHNSQSGVPIVSHQEIRDKGYNHSTSNGVENQTTSVEIVSV